MDKNPNQTFRYWAGGKRAFEQDRFFVETLEQAGWQQGDADNWDACWYTGMPKPALFKQTGQHCKINHIPGNNALTVKSRLHESLSALHDRAREVDPELTARLQFLPMVFSMPEDYHRFQQAALASPAKRWILKPKNAARGKGIQLVRNPADVPMEPVWMVQEYLENPHTMRGRKYVLRLYVLIASITPLRVYLYHQGFAKLASAPYDSENADNPYSYLTNPDINALNLDAEVPVEFVEFGEYRHWLRAEGHDDDLLFQRIKDMAALTCISAVEAMRERTAAFGADPQGCYELLGLDCLVDEQLKPWILECNLSPSLEVCAGLENGGRKEEAIKRAVVADMIDLVGLTAPTVAESTPERQLIVEAETENARTGGFERVYPASDNNQYLPFFTQPRLADWVLANASSTQPLLPPRLARGAAHDVITDDDQVMVYATRSGQLHALNESASLIWLLALDGMAPDTIADTLLKAFKQSANTAVDPWMVRQQVWDSLADWAKEGLLIQADRQGKSRQQILKPDSEQADNAAFSMIVTTGVFHVACFTDSAAVVHRLAPLLLPMTAQHQQRDCSRLEIVRDTPGYTIVLDGQVIASGLMLAKVVATVLSCLAQQAPAPNEVFIDACLVTPGQNANSGVMVVSADRSLQNALALKLARAHSGAFSRGLRFFGDQAGVGLIPTGLPAQVTGPLALAMGGPERQVLRDSDKGCFVAASDLSHRSYRINTLIIPVHEPLPNAKRTAPVSVTDALSHLMAGCAMKGNTPLDAEQFAELVAWLEHQNRVLVDARDLNKAANAVAQYLSYTDKAAQNAVNQLEGD